MSRDDPALSSRLKASPILTVLFGAFAVIGTGAFVFGILGERPLRVWQAFLVNYLFWMGSSCGAVLFVAVLNMTGAKWGRPLKRLAEAFGAFLPIGFILFGVLYFGRMEIFPWIREPIQVREAWLNVPFLFFRNGLGLLLLTAVALAMISSSLRGDREWKGNGPKGKFGIAGGAQLPVAWKRQQILSPILGIIYAFVLTLLAFDLVMSLDSRWYSTLLGGYFLVGSFYAGVAAVYLLALLVGQTGALKECVGLRHFHDMGKLLLAFALFTGYLFYAQFLTIWYGNLPEETRYVILRVKLTPWEPLAWVVLFMIFAIPFFVLLSRKVKVKRIPMIVLSLMILAGMWLERFILVAPSLWKGKEFPLGVTEVLITAGFLGIAGICVTAFLSRVPILPISDPLFREAMELNKQRLEP